MSLGGQSLIQAQQEAHNATQNIFKTFSSKVKHQCNETVKSIQYCKLNMHHSKNAEEWMKRLRIAAKECNYQEFNMWVKEQCIYGMTDNNMLIDIRQ